MEQPTDAVDTAQLRALMRHQPNSACANLIARAADELDALRARDTRIEELRANLDWLKTCAGDLLAYIEAGHRISHADPVGDRCLSDCTEAWYVERDSLKAAIRDAARAAASPPATGEAGE